MADIAILVAEEYERRVKKNSRKGDGDLLEIKFFTKNAKKMVKEQDSQLLKKWISEPKSQIGLAASNGFFSA